jgi:hypothetical protein
MTSRSSPTAAPVHDEALGRILRLRKITEDEGVVLDISIVLQRDDLLRLDDMGWKNADRCKELTAGWEMPPQGRRG